MRFGIHYRRVGKEPEFAEFGRQGQSEFASDQFFTLPTVFDDFLDGAHFQIVLPTEFAEFREPGHVAIGAEDFANDGRFS